MESCKLFWVKPLSSYTVWCELRFHMSAKSMLQLLMTDDVIRDTDTSSLVSQDSETSSNKVWIE